MSTHRYKNRLYEAYYDMLSLLTTLKDNPPNHDLYSYCDLLISDLFIYFLNNKPVEKSISFWSYWVFNIKERIFMFWYNFKLLHQKIDIIFSVSSENQLTQQLPVAEFLIKQNKTILFFSTKKRIVKQLRELNFSTYYLGNIIPAVTYTELVNIEENRLIHWIERKKIVIRYYEKILISAFKKFSPSAFVAGNDLILDSRIAARICKDSAIPTFCIQHGSVNAMNPLYKHLIVDTFFVFGERVKSELDSIFLGSTKIQVTGSPSMDIYMRNNSMINNADEIWDDSKKVKALILLSGPGHSTSKDHYDNLLRLFCDLSNEIIELSVCFKPHAKDLTENYHPIFYANNCVNVKILENSFLDKKKISTMQLIAMSDLVITGGSTAAIDAMALRKPVFTVDLNHEYALADFIIDGATVHAETTHEFIGNIRKFINDKNSISSTQKRAEVFIEGIYSQSDTNASESISQAIIEQISSKV